MQVKNIDPTQRENLSSGAISYDQKQLIGHGSFGTVYKVRLQDGKFVAIKEVPLRGEQQKRSFKVEVERLSSLNHPNIIEFIKNYETNNVGTMMIEYAPDGSLSDLLHNQKDKRYGLKHATSWALQVAQAVSYLHGLPKPLIHRDLKPENLLLFSNGKTIKICDFGIACEQKTSMTNDTGTMSYMAPEVFVSGESRFTYTELCDVYSWSIVFWEILTRQKPYQNVPNTTNHYALMLKLGKGMRPDMIENCPDPIWNLITRTWDHNFRNRPSMAEVVEQMKFINSLAGPRLQSEQDASKSEDAREGQDGHQQPPDEFELIYLKDKYNALKKRLLASISFLKSNPPECDCFEESRRLKNEAKDLKDKNDVLYSLCGLNNRLQE